MAVGDAAQFRVTAVEGAVILTPVGEIDMASCGPFRRELEAAVTAPSGPTVVCCDLSETTFMDATGLGALAAAHLLAERHGRELRISGAHGAVLRILTVTKLADLLHSYDGLGAAGH
jgi:anti-sigma B factor antagonist